MRIERVSVHELSSSDIEMIDKFIDDNQGLVFHYIGFNKIVSHYSKTTLQYWLAYKKNQLIGVCPVHTFKIGYLKSLISGLTSFEIPYGGWVYIQGESNKSILNSVKLHYNESLLISTSFFSNETDLTNKNNKLRETAVIDFQEMDEDSLWNNISSKRKNMIRKAEKSGVYAKILQKEGIRDFYRLLLQMNNRTNMISQNIEYYQDLFEMYGSEKACILISYLQEIPLSAIMLVGNKNAWHYWQGASDTDYNLGASEFLQWKAILHAFNQNTKLYDLCVIDQQQLPQIAKFKLSFGGETLNYQFISKRHIVHKAMNRISKLVCNRRND